MPKHNKTKKTKKNKSLPKIGATNKGVFAASDDVRGWNMATHADDENHLHLYLYGIVGDWWEENEAIDLIKALNQYPDLREITLHINSVGGIIDEGIAMLNVLRGHRAVVNVIVEALAASIASVVMLAADEGRLIMYRTAFIMIHNASWGAWGTADELEKAAQDLRKFEGVLVDEYTIKTTLSKEEVQQKVDDATYFTAQEALEIGLIDAIIDPNPNIEAATNQINPTAWEMSQHALAMIPNEIKNNMPEPTSTSNNTPTTAVAVPAAVVPVTAVNPTTPATATASHDQQVLWQQNEQNRRNAVIATFDNVGGATGDYAAIAQTCLNDMSCNAEKAAQRINQEQTRRTEVTSVFIPFGGQSGQHATLATDCIKDHKCTVAEAKSKMLTAMTENSPQQSIAGGYNNVRITQDAQETQIELAVNALLAKANLAERKDENPFAFMSLLDLARNRLNQAGINTDGINPLKVVGQAFAMQTTSDFSVILERTIGSTIEIGYTKEDDLWRKLVKVGECADFKDTEVIKFGAIGTLDEVNEKGEYKNKDIPDAQKEKFSIGTKGNIIAVTRKMIINDDIFALLDLANWVGRTAAKTISKAVFHTLFSQQNLMQDGYPLLHVQHNNIAEAAFKGDINEDNLDEMTIKMAEQKDITGTDDLDIDPAILLVPKRQNKLAQKWMNSENIPIAKDKARDEPNSVFGLAEVIPTSHFKQGYILLANPADYPVLQVNFLNGVQSPFVDTTEGWRVDGTEMKVRLDFGVGVVDYRGIQSNNAALTLAKGA